MRSDAAAVMVHVLAARLDGRAIPGADRSLPDRCILRLEGDYWTMVYAGQVVRIRDVVGLRHLAQLLWHPHREFHALDLMRAVALAGGSRAGRPPGPGVCGADGRATAMYRQRMRELEEELIEAQTLNDLGRKQAITAELDALLRELRAGSQGRRMKTDAERARVAVTKGIKAALGRIRQGHLALAAHLEVSVKRGYVCVYRPDPRLPIRWDC